MVHIEGGWPKDVASDDIDQVKRYRKKVEKDDHFVQAMLTLSHRIEECVKQHIAGDIFPMDVFAKSSVSESSKTDTKINLRTLKVIK